MTITSVVALGLLFVPRPVLATSCPSPDLTKILFDSLNLSLPELSSVASAHARGATEEACGLLSNYYLTSDTGKSLRLPLVPVSGTGTVGGAADAALKYSMSYARPSTPCVYGARMHAAFAPAIHTAIKIRTLNTLQMHIKRPRARVRGHGGEL